MKISPNGATAYVLRSPGGVSVIDLATNTITGAISHGGYTATGMGVTPDGDHIYVTHFGVTVSVIDLATHTVTSTITVGVNPLSVAFSPDGARAYVANLNDATVSVIDTATHTVTTAIPIDGGGVEAYPASVAVSPDGAHAYVASLFKANGTVSVIDTATNTVTITIPVGPEGVAIGPDGTRVYVTNTEDNTVSVISTEPVYSSPSQGLIGELIGAVDRGGGGGWLVIGNHLIPVPTRSPFLSIIAEAAAPHLGHAIALREKI